MRALGKQLTAIVILLLYSCADSDVKMTGSSVPGMSPVTSQDVRSEDHAIGRQRSELSQDVRAELPAEVQLAEESIMPDTLSEDSEAEEASLPTDSDAEQAETDSAEQEAAQPEEPKKEFKCLSQSVLLTSGESTQLRWQLPHENDEVSVEFADEMIGSIIMESNQSALYYAPDVISQSKLVQILARIEGTTLMAACAVQLQADQDLGVKDDGLLEGLVGKVYELPEGIQKLPNFSRMQHQSEIVVRELNIPNRAFDAGFPGAEELVEWFGIQFSGRIKINKAGQYHFKLSSDDGANLYINGNKIIDNDGQHAVVEKTGSVYLSAGEHEIRVDYFQGPRYHIALQLFWKMPGSAGYDIIAGEYLSRPK